MGLFDLGGDRHVMVPADALVFGPARYLGLTLVAVSSFQTPPDLDVTALTRFR